MALETELAFFNSKRAEWVKQYGGKFAAIQDETLLGFFDEWEQALKAAYKAFSYTRPFLIKEVLEKDRVYFVGATSGAFQRYFRRTVLRAQYEAMKGFPSFRGK